MKRLSQLFSYQILNRLREGNHTNKDIMQLKERIILPSSANYRRDAAHLFIQNS